MQLVGHLLPVQRKTKATKLIDGPEYTEATSSPRPAARKTPENVSIRHQGPAGHDRRLRKAPGRHGQVLDKMPNPPHCFVLHDRPGALGHRNHRARSRKSTDRPARRTSPSNSPTPAATAFQDVTRGSPQRGRQSRRSGRATHDRPKRPPATSPSSSTTKSSPGRSSTTATTRTASTAARAPRSRAASTASRRPRTWPASCSGGPAYNLNADQPVAPSPRRSASRR